MNKIVRPLVENSCLKKSTVSVDIDETFEIKHVTSWRNPYESVSLMETPYVDIFKNEIATMRYRYLFLPLKNVHTVTSLSQRSFSSLG